MKYDFIILSSLPFNSGCFLRAKYLASALKKAGAKVKLVIPFRTKPLMLDFALNFIKYLFAVFITDYRIGMAIKPYPNTLIPLLVKKFIKHNKIIVDIDDIDFGYRKGVISTISRWIQKPFPRHFDIITYHNSMLKKFIKDEYGVINQQLHVLKQGVDMDVFNYRIKINDFKKRFFLRYKLNKNIKVLIYTAHLNIASDLDVVFRNIKSILEKYNCFLIIAGGGPLLNYYKQLADNLNLQKIYFTGYLSPYEIVKYIMISDFSLVYYKDKKVNYYRSSMKLREHLALKKKIICNDVGELKLFKKFTYQSSTDIVSFIKLIEKLLKKNPVDRREIKGYSFIKKNYDWAKIGKEFLLGSDPQ